MEHIRKFNEELESEKSLKNKLYKQDYESQIKALQYVIDFYEILSFEDIIKKRDNLVQQLKDFEKTVR
jgi:hypothetical protein